MAELTAETSPFKPHYWSPWGQLHIEDTASKGNQCRVQRHLTSVQDSNANLSVCRQLLFPTDPHTIILFYQNVSNIPEEGCSEARSELWLIPGQAFQVEAVQVWLTLDLLHMKSFLPLDVWSFGRCFNRRCLNPDFWDMTRDQRPSSEEREKTLVETNSA